MALLGVKRLVALSGIVIFLAFSTSQIAAETPRFDVQFNSFYKVHEDGNTTVTQNFIVKNLQTEYYPTEYLVDLGESRVFGIRAYDQEKMLKVDPLVGNATKVKVKLGSVQVGEGKSYSFSLAYETPEVAHRVGRIWEVNIPLPSTLENTGDFSIGLYVPENFGRVIYKKPATSDSGKGLIWHKDDLGRSGVMMAFDPRSLDKPYQAYDFRLRYHLYNSRLYPVTTEIALPMDTSYQKIFLRELSPRPIDVRIDEDGNWLAKYYLGPAGKAEILAAGSVGVFLEPYLSTPVNPSPGNYLKENMYWEVKDKNIQARAKELPTPEKVYDYVLSNLKYDSSVLSRDPSRKGALSALSGRFSAICLDFTDLFIGLARAGNIPAREVEGFAYTTNPSRQPSSLSKDLLHAWPEYYDAKKSSWVMVDPTWGNTSGSDYFHTFDLNHIAFAIHGTSSRYPAPAGMYKSGETGKDVEVLPSNADLDVSESPRIGFRVDVPKLATAGFGIVNRVLVENLGPTLNTGQTIVASSGELGIVNPVTLSGPLPPFSVREKEVVIRPSAWFRETNGIISLEINGETRRYPIKVLPVYRSNFVLIVAGFVTIGILSLFAQIARGLFIQKHRREDNIRRKS